MSEIIEQPILEPVVADVIDAIPIDIAPTARGEQVEWVEVNEKDQDGFEQKEKVHAVAVVVDKGNPEQHNIYELDGKYWVSGIHGPEPACADTIAEAKQLVDKHYDYRAAWEEYMTHNPPPVTIQNQVLPINTISRGSE